MSPTKKTLPHRFTLVPLTRQLLFGAAAVLTGFLMAGLFAKHRHQFGDLAAKKSTAYPASAGAMPAPSAQAEQDTSDFLGQTRTTDHSEECFPIHIRDQAKVAIYYLYCSEQAYQHDGEAVTISETFKVPTSIARRYNFWRRIYSLWGKDQYVMHIAEYPEVVLETFDGSHLGSDLGPVAREIRVKKIAKEERAIYGKLFLAMHKNRDHEERFTPAMKRLAASMAHIKDPEKYMIAYKSMRLQRGQRDFIASGLLVAPRYLANIEAEFKNQGIPTEITRIAFVESSFNLKAQSKVGASGVYQIMPATGHQYLKMVDGIDERNDPIKASRAAAKLLRLNYDLTGTWPLAITAYNHGVGGIRRATRAARSNDIVDLINRYHNSQFGFASKNYYASFLGMLGTLKDADRLFPEIPKVAALAYSPLRLPKPTAVREVCKKFSVTVAQIAELNPDLSHSMLKSVRPLPTGYVIKLPAQPKTQVLASVSRHH